MKLFVFLESCLRLKLGLSQVFLVVFIQNILGMYTVAYDYEYFYLANSVKSE